MAPAPEGPSRTIQVETDAFIAKFTTRGGRLLSLKLKKFRETARPDSPLMELVTPAEGGQLPLGLVVETRSGRFNDRVVNYGTAAPAQMMVRGPERASVRFTANVAGLKVVKTVDFDGTGYVFNVDAAVSGPPGDVEAIGLDMSEALTAHEGYYDIPEIQALVDNKTAVKAETAPPRSPTRSRISPSANQAAAKPGTRSTVCERMSAAAAKSPRPARSSAH